MDVVQRWHNWALNMGLVVLTKLKKRKKLVVWYFCVWRPWFLAHTVEKNWLCRRYQTYAVLPQITSQPSVLLTVGQFPSLFILSLVILKQSFTLINKSFFESNKLQKKIKKRKAERGKMFWKKYSIFLIIESKQISTWFIFKPFIWTGRNT